MTGSAAVRRWRGGGRRGLRPLPLVAWKPMSTRTLVGQDDAERLAGGAVDCPPGGADRIGASSSRSDWIISSPGGLDTVAYHFGSQGGSELLSQLVAWPDVVPYARGLLVTTPLSSGLRVMAWPDYGVVKAEARLGAIVDADRRSHRLADRGELLDGEAAVVRSLAETFGREPTDRAVMSRYDLTVETEQRPDFGWALIRSMKPLCPAGYRVRTFERPGSAEVESVSYVTARRSVPVFRTYDKNVEANSGPAGARVRFEAQNRPRGGQRRTPETVATGDLQHDFARTLSPVMKSAQEVTVTNSDGVIEVLAQKVARGELTHRKADSLAGSVAFLRRYGRAFYGDNDLSGYRLRELRAAGVAVDDELPPEARLEVGELLRELVEGFSVG